MRITVSMIIERVVQSGFEIMHGKGKVDTVLYGTRLYDGELPPGILMIGDGVEFTKALGIEYASIQENNTVICVVEDAFFLLSTSSMPAALNCILDAFSYFAAFENDMIKAVTDANQLQQLIDIAEPYFDNPMFIGNWQGQIFAYTKGFADDYFRPVWHHIVTQYRLPLSSVQILRNHPENLAYFINENNVSIYDFPEENYTCIIGWLENSLDFHYYVQIMQYETPITETTRVMAELFHDTMRKITPLHVATSISGTFSNLLDGHAFDEEKMAWILAAFGWDKDDAYMLLSFRNNGEDTLAEEALCGELQQRIVQGICFLWNTHPIMLIRDTDLAENINIIEQLMTQLSFACGASIPSVEWNNLPTRFKQAEIAMEYVKSKGEISFCSMHIWEYILKELNDSVHFSNLCHPAIYAIAKHDKKRGSKLLHTLYTYLLNERNQSLTAQILFIHRNTLLNRLQRIEELVAINLEDSNERLHILLSCYVQESLMN